MPTRSLISRLSPRGVLPAGVLAIACLATVSVATTSIAQDQPRTRDGEGRMLNENPDAVTRVYEVADLIAGSRGTTSNLAPLRLQSRAGFEFDTEDLHRTLAQAQEELQAARHEAARAASGAAYTLRVGGQSRGHGFGGGGVAVFPDAPAVPAPAGATFLRSTDGGDTLIETITNTIAPTTWQNNGGPTGTLFIYQDKLVVSHTPDIQQRVSQLIDDLRNENGVVVEAVLVSTRPGDGVGSGVPDNFWDSLGEDNQIAAVSGSGFDGEVVRVSDGKSLRYVSDVSPVVAANAVGYDVQLSSLQTGFTFVAKPSLREDSAVIDLSASMVKIVDAGVEAGENASEVPVPDRITTDSREINARVKVPLDKWMVVGGMNRTGADGEGGPMYLLIRVKTTE